MSKKFPFPVIFLCLFGTVFAFTLLGDAKEEEEKTGGYITMVSPRQAEDGYIERLRQLRMQIEQKEKELESLEKRLKAKRLQLVMAETKLATMEKLRTRLFFRRDFDLYVVKEGDTLWSIAQKDEVYGDGSKWQMLYTANRDILESPHLIYPGQILIVPRMEGETK